ncbi:hypothetical protein NC653_010305 [Populus alba x Populus x berolinensis]|uniref:Uncharacterized protein n=1 Tax=Populus alba x Populus x berolinensis TaxID=444605 RepID=A0AAD6QZH3_9ROSI|nr:hypothetical protein NC653_010305 [Populus alba x Populus x berolinensis]
MAVSAVSFMQIPQVQEFLVLYNFSIPILRVRSLWWPKEMKVGRHISRYYYCLSLVTPQKSMVSILKTGCSEVENASEKSPNFYKLRHKTLTGRYRILRAISSEAKPN